MAVLLAITGCSVQPRYHNRGLHITMGSGANGRSHKQTQPLKAFVSTNETIRDQKCKWVELSTNDTSLPEMHIPQKIIAAGDVSLNWRVFPYTMGDSLSRRMRVMTVIGDTFMMHGKLVAASEHGIYLYNSHNPWFWVKNTSYGKMQKKILNKVLFVPYKDIKAIKKGGTIASKMERILNGLFVIWVILWGFVTGAWAWNANSDFFTQSIIEAVIAVAMLIAVVLSIPFMVVLSIVLTPILYLINLPFNKMKGRYWLINHKPDQGEGFYRNVVENHERYRLFKEDIEK